MIMTKIVSSELEKDIVVTKRPGTTDVPKERLKEAMGQIEADLAAVFKGTFSDAEIEKLTQTEEGSSRKTTIETNSTADDSVKFESTWNFGPDREVSVMHVANTEDAYPFITLTVTRTFDGGCIKLLEYTRLDGKSPLTTLNLMPAAGEDNNSAITFHVTSRAPSDVTIHGFKQLLASDHIHAVFPEIDLDRIRSDRAYRIAQYEHFMQELIGTNEE